MTDMTWHLHNVDNSTPTGNSISITRVDQGLGDDFEQIVRFQVRPPEHFTHAEQLVWAGAADTEVLGLADAANQVHAADVRL